VIAQLTARRGPELRRSRVKARIANQRLASLMSPWRGDPLAQRHRGGSMRASAGETQRMGRAWIPPRPGWRGRTDLRAAGRLARRSLHAAVYQPRTRDGRESLQELAHRSKQGLMQPICAADRSNRYEIIAGERAGARRKSRFEESGARSRGARIRRARQAGENIQRKTAPASRSSGVRG